MVAPRIHARSDPANRDPLTMIEPGEALDPREERPARRDERREHRCSQEGHAPGGVGCRDAEQRDQRSAVRVLIVNTGTPKGKTVAALGLLLRATGRDMRAAAPGPASSCAPDQGIHLSRH